MIAEEALSEEKPAIEKSVSDSETEPKETMEEVGEVKEKPSKEERKEKEEDIVEERIYTVPLQRAWIVPRSKRGAKAVRVLRDFIRRHMKADMDSIKISNEVNEKIWARGIKKPPRKIRVRATKDSEGIITVHLAEGN